MLYAVLEVLNGWSESGDKDHPLDVIYLDYKKAFVLETNVKIWDKW